MRSFFGNSDLLDYIVTKPMSHIRMNWELTWDREAQIYLPEEDSYASRLNALFLEFEQITPPKKYHDNEDRLAEYVIKHLKWPIYKKNGFWRGEDYAVILEQGGFNDINEENLLLAARGRIKAAIDRGQKHFDQMEEAHRKMLGAVITIILYHRENFSD